MGIQNYGKIEQGRHKKLKHRIIGIIIAAIAVCVIAGIIGVLAGDNEGYQNSTQMLKENHELKERVAELEQQVGDLQSQLDDRDSYIASMPTVAPTPYMPGPSAEPQETPVAELESPRE